jgi:hypothetical protein
MPKGVKVSPTGRAVAMLEREAEKITKKLGKYDALRRDLIAVQKALAAIKGMPFQGVDAGGINHVVAGRRSA